jgi:hypothetical protein
MEKKLQEGATREPLKLEAFKGKFNQKDFIESLNKRITGLKDQEFNVIPYIRTFESATEELLRLKRKLQSKIEDQEDSQMFIIAFKFSAGVSQIKRKIKDFGDTLEHVHKEFESLDTRLTDVGNTAIRIGEQLETIDKHRTRAAEAKDVILYFLEFNEGSFKRLDNLFKTGPEGEYKVGIIARRLITIAKEVDVVGTENVLFLNGRPAQTLKDTVKNLKRISC